MAKQENITRRAALGEIAAATVAMPAVAMPAVVDGQPHSDADLLAIGREWERCAVISDKIMAQHTAAERQVSAAWDDIPAVLLVREDDELTRLRLPPRHRSEPHHWRGFHSTDKHYVQHQRANKLNARIEEIATAWEAHSVRCKAAWTAIGGDEIEERMYAEVERNAELRARIMHMPATTIEGVLLKVRAAFWCRSGDLWLPELDEGERALTDEGLAFSAMDDLRALAFAGRPPFARMVA